MAKTAQFWVPPVVGLLVGLALAAIALTLDQVLTWPADPPPPLFSGSASTAASLLSAIAGAGTSLLTLIFTIITVVIQLATGQYSARALRTLYTDRPSHFTIGVFVATITYSLVVLLRVSDSGDPLGVTMMLAVLLAILSVVTFAIFAHHIAHLVRVGSLVATIAADTRRVIEEQMPLPVKQGSRESESGDDRPEPGSGRSIQASESGVVVRLDEQALLEAALSAEAVIEVVPALGDFVPEGATLFRVWGSGLEDEDLRRTVGLDVERRLERDPAWGLRILVDTCLRALSPSVNDPTTAVQALDRIHELLRMLATREMPQREWRDANGAVRLLVRTREWEDFVTLAIDEVRRSGAQHLQVLRRLRALLLDVAEVAPAARRPPLGRRLELVDAMAAQLDTIMDRQLGGQADSQGLGGPVTNARPGSAPR